MCTAITFHRNNSYFGRNLDLEYSYNETVTITPRHFPLKYRHMNTMTKHFAFIGMAYVNREYPLYYDAVNEEGLGMAGLHFPGNAHYVQPKDGKDNVTPFEFIPWILSQCASVDEAKRMLSKTVLTDERFSSDLPLSPLHWIIADKKESVVVEQTRSGLAVYDNPVGVLTNNPPFLQHLTRLNDYMALSAEPPKNNFCDSLSFDTYSRGMGALGLPGDLTSVSRFVRAAFVKANSICGDSESECVGQFFHILTSVEQQRGCVYLGDGKYNTTVYSSCCNMDRGIYYYTTYGNRSITAVDMHRTDLDGFDLYCYPLVTQEQITFSN